MTDVEIIEALATQVMGWTKQGIFPNDFWADTSGNFQVWVGQWEPLIEPEDSKMVREKLAELGFIVQSLTRSPSGFTFDCSKHENGAELFSSDPWVNDGISEEKDWPTEERAVALCALKIVGL